MILDESSLVASDNGEIPALIETLLATEERLEDLTAGQVDSVAGRDGRTFLLRRAQDQLRHSESVRQASILNALPTHIALLDGQGVIVSVNEAWRSFADANLLPAVAHGIGINYLTTCDDAVGADSSEASQVADGIRAVLEGTRKSLSIEYPCHSPTEQRWFLLSVTPLASDRPNGAVVMHLNITKRKAAETALEVSELRYHLLFQNMLEGYAYCRTHFEQDQLRSFTYLEVNSAFEKLTGLKDIIGRKITDIIPGFRESSKEILDVYCRVALTGQPEKCETFVESLGVWLSITAYSSDREHFVAVFENITERKQADESLRASKAMLEKAIHANQQILNNSLDVVCTIDAGGQFTSLSAASTRLFGYSPEEMIGHPFIEFIHPDDREKTASAAALLPEGRELHDYENRYIRKDGTTVTISWSAIWSVVDQSIFCVGRDCTERTLANESLRQSEEEFRALAEAMPQMVWITRGDGWTIYVSQQWMDYTGLTLEESLGHGWNEPFHPDDKQRAWEAWQQATTTLGTYSIECRLRRADGFYRWWLIRGVPQMDANGNILKWFGTCTDIHELKLAELEITRTNQALRESDEKFRELADNINDVFWITSPDFTTMHYVSPGYESIWGRSAESLYANPHQWVETILADERENAFGVFTTLMGTAPEVSVEYRIARPDGTVRWIHDRGFQVRDSAGQLVRLTGIATDITERKKLEAQLGQAQKMEAIGTLAGGIAHDFNNILAAIIGYSEMARRSISQDSRAQTHLEQVLIASARAKNLVNQILTFSRSEEADRETLDLQQVIYETLKMVKVSLPSTIEIRQHIDTDVPSVLGDATQLQQVTLNLCVNAVQAMKEHGGVLEVRLTCLDIDHGFPAVHQELKEGPHVRLDVSDTGCGMDRATRERIFEPFFTTKAPGEGTGLGLAVAHGVIKSHGGAIVVHSELGVGTTFAIYLPVHERLQAAVIHESDPVPGGNGEHILFLDDEEALASLGKSMLEDLGYRVTTKTDSAAALAAFRSQPQDFDLVITDQTMPHLKGGDLATALLAIRPTLPIILLTGYSATMSPEKAEAIGIRELLYKPTTMQALAEAIRRALGQGGKD